MVYGSFPFSSKYNQIGKAKRAGRGERTLIKKNRLFVLYETKGMSRHFVRRTLRSF